MNGLSAYVITAPEGAVIVGLLYNYNFLLLARPIKPKSPEPKSQTAAGTGTVVRIIELVAAF